MAVQRPYTVKSVVHGTDTWNATTAGGPLSIGFSHIGNAVPDRVANDIYCSQMLIPEYDLIVRIRLRDMIFTTQPGTQGPVDLVITIVTEAGDVAMTFKDMVYIGAEANLDRSIPGEVELSFNHQHDEDSNPVSST